MPKFFADGRDIDTEGGTVTLRGADAKHIALSLRMAVGDPLTVSDGCGTDYDCRLTRIREDECILGIEGSHEGRGEPPAKITLYMAYPKGDKLETVIQKAVELGAARIVPFVSERCIKRPVKEREEKQLARHCAIANEAAKQCGRSRLPEVTAPISFSALTEAIGVNELTLLCYEGERERTLKDALRGRKCRTLGVIVGSEGGFSPEEAEALVAHGAVSVSLGGRILRCETAPEFCLSAVSYELEM